MSALPFSAVLLAAGNASRMQGQFKQLLPLPTAAGEAPLVRIATLAVLAAGPREVVVVTGHRGREVMAALEDLPLRFQPNPRYLEGQPGSVAAGLAALQAPCSAVMVCLADLPLIEPRDHVDLVEHFAGLPGTAIQVPEYQGARGNPVIFSASRVPEVLAGTLRPGCRRLIEDHPADVVRYAAGHDHITTDIDTPQAYEHMRQRLDARLCAGAA
jgi:molybdenum cofactor cytidylyltransferase